MSLKLIYFTIYVGRYRDEIDVNVIHNAFNIHGLFYSARVSYDGEVGVGVALCA